MTILVLAGHGENDIARCVADARDDEGNVLAYVHVVLNVAVLDKGSRA